MTIELHNVKPRYMSESEVAGSDIYLQPSVVFEQGRKYMVCARSGHGKTSLLNFIYGISDQYDGSIERKAENGKRKAENGERLRLSVLSYMFQDLCLFPELTAMENVQLKNRLTDFKNDSEIERMLDALLPEGKKHQPVATLSLGQRQRVAAVRALCQPMRFLLLDEPFSHLDHDTAAQVAAMISAEVERQGAGLIVTALDPTDLFRFDKTMRL
ncbi:MAG: ATP-binding cassette domain-containing protein [Bacteroidales bacterium]|nr:ATP-binding cassette domain-containing protein [Bacteroidales bacterium]